MNITEALRSEHSHRMSMAIVNYIGSDASRFKELMDVFSGGEYRITQRASWPMSIVVEEHPDLIIPWFPKLIEWLENTSFHISVKRNIIRLLQTVDIPDAYLGKILDLCFQYLRNEKEAIAVRAFAMQVIFNAVKKYPELKFELRVSIENMLPGASPGIQNRGNKLIQKLSK